MNHLATPNGYSQRNPPSPTGWDDEAACKGMSSVFFKDSPTYDPTAAKAVCRRCPCLVACLDDARDHESGDPRNHAGVRAGYTPDELVDLRRSRKRTEEHTTR